MNINRRQTLVMLGTVLVTPMPTLYAADSHQSAIPRVYKIVAERHSIPTSIFYAVALTESGKQYDSTLLPWPWTLNIDGDGNYYESYHAAKIALSKALEKSQSVDIGLMQINWRWHQDKLQNIATALNPLQNLNYGARILHECYQQSGDWWEAVGHYHSPANTTKARRNAERYRQRVKAHWTRL